MLDPLANLVRRFELRAGVFHTGALCRNVSFESRPDIGYIHLLRAGVLRLETVGEPSRNLDRPSAIFYPRPTSHRLLPLEDEGALLVCATLEFGGPLRDPLLRHLPDVLVVPLAEARSLEGTLNLLFEEALAETGPGRQGVLDRLAEVAVLQLLRDLMQRGLTRVGVLAGLADPQLVHALTAIHDRHDSRWTLDALARRAGMSRSRFAARFHAVVGTPPGDYLAQWRLQQAQALLLQGESIKRVADEVGYGSASALARLFQARLGMSPGAWLRQTERT